MGIMVITSVNIGSSMKQEIETFSSNTSISLIGQSVTAIFCLLVDGSELTVEPKNSATTKYDMGIV